MLSHYFYYRVFITSAYSGSSYPLNPTQNHLVHSILPIFNLSTQPSFLVGSKHPETKKSEGRKNTSNSRKRFILKIFTLFTSVPLTAILPSRYEPFWETYPSASLVPPDTLPAEKSPDPLRGKSVCRKHKQSPVRQMQ